MWFAGLRGAISFALVSTLSYVYFYSGYILLILCHIHVCKCTYTSQSMQIQGVHKDVFVSATLSTVLFTTVVFGGLTEPMLGWLGLKLSPPVGGTLGCNSSGGDSVHDKTVLYELAPMRDIEFKELHTHDLSHRCALHTHA